MQQEVVEQALARLRGGEVVACATETLMGLLADAENPSAVERVLALKGRAEGHPMGLLCPDVAAARAMASQWPLAADSLAHAHWPGPLTLIVAAKSGLHPSLLKDDKVAIRVPGPSPALTLARAFGGALTATSANRTGEPALSQPNEVRRVFGDALFCIDAVSPGGAPSTLVDVTVDPPKVVRAGAVDCKLSS